MGLAKIHYARLQLQSGQGGPDEEIQLPVDSLIRLKVKSMRMDGWMDEKKRSGCTYVDCMDELKSLPPTFFPFSFKPTVRVPHHP